MTLHFFCDHCVPSYITDSLRAAGYDALRLRDALPPRTPDFRVIDKARELDRILLSLNGDFSDIVAYPPGQYKGIIAIQLHNRLETTNKLMERLLGFLSVHSDQEYYHEKLLIVEVHRIRIWHSKS